MADFSVFDLAFITQGSQPADALHHSLDLAQHAERWGYKRFWLAEHHNMVGIASSATSVVIGYIAGGTKTIRVGSGGVMLPNHSPLVIAEQFGTLECLYPGRIDLGLGRAPGTDQRTLQSLRRSPMSSDHFPQDVIELQELLGPFLPGQAVQAVPGTGTKVPIWILGSSLFGAQLAAALGLPYAFASHFAPGDLMQAIDVYRTEFKPSAQLKNPRLMLGVNVIAADKDEEARKLFTSIQQSFTNMHRGNRGQLPPPVDDIADYWSPFEETLAAQKLSCSFVGSRKVVQEGLESFVEKTGADELMVASAIYDHSARLRSYEILADVHQALGRTPAY